MDDFGFTEVTLGDFWFRFVRYQDGNIGITIPFHGDWVTLAGTMDELGELGVRLAGAIARISELEVK